MVTWLCQGLPGIQSLQKKLAQLPAVDMQNPRKLLFHCADCTVTVPKHLHMQTCVSADNCFALVEDVKFLPLGVIEWGFLQDLYNVYANEINQAPCNLNPLKMKLQVLVNHANPTCNPNFPTYVCNTKAKKKKQWMRGGM
ncbi:hypothetical protein VP01_4145g4 [Puccinia sorghi]|uniref:Uncharacterized protein n=1 Tax=Puccinia sorghi TaxID=27349 RepID=A0A0L6UR14_9BASI|nr:hypothetical protein VP01_4145g4 [Puccinia sorghi]